jgi:hypothetical protein
LSCHRHDNLFAVGGALAAQHLTVNALANAPIEEPEPHIHSDRGLAPRFGDQRSNVGQQFAWGTNVGSSSLIVIIH